MGKRRLKPGPDPDFPWLSEYERFAFPAALHAEGDIIGVGGNLSPGMLLSAYEQGIFPWYNADEPVIWQSPNPRFVIFPGQLHVSSSMEKILRRGDFAVSFDRDFPAVIAGCAEVPRPGQDGTWITDDIVAAYTALHRAGWVHSAEAWDGGNLAGGCYGIRLGNVFVGESMFARKSNASKAAFITLARTLFADKLAFIDCQVPTPHLERLGGEEIPRREYLFLLEEILAAAEPDFDGASRRGHWGALYGRP
ncbi:MAG: leucyl/phenylalanyl-tRNA--protein transferase [Spirochaetaceae bacterium]|jgi:leucyl/phenylalanyl-tRNA--protein transferase|nr:leucyl/phenylalanyl-tRNA--protein transferase [Spirochaetaceae bacterium]